MELWTGDTCGPTMGSERCTKCGKLNWFSDSLEPYFVQCWNCKKVWHLFFDEVVADQYCSQFGIAEGIMEDYIDSYREDGDIKYETLAEFIASGEEKPLEGRRYVDISDEADRKKLYEELKAEFDKQEG